MWPRSVGLTSSVRAHRRAVALQLPQQEEPRVEAQRVVMRAVQRAVERGPVLIEHRHAAHTRAAGARLLLLLVDILPRRVEAAARRTWLGVGVGVGVGLGLGLGLGLRLGLGLGLGLDLGLGLAW